MGGSFTLGPGESTGGLRRCKARHGQMPHVQCEGEVTEQTMHIDDHHARLGEKVVRWDDMVAIYPGSSEFGRAVNNDVARNLESMVRADRTQVGGRHYSEMKVQPWAVIEALDLDFFHGNALKYLMRAGRKGPALEDLKKAKHYIEKCIEREERRG